MVGVASDCGVPKETAEALSNTVTANHFRKLLPAEHLKKVCSQLCRLAAQKCREHVTEKVEVKCIMTDPAGVILGRASAAG